MKFKKAGAVLITAVLLTACQSGASTHENHETSESTISEAADEEEITVHNPGEIVTDPQQALKYLKDGNERYVSETDAHRNSADDRRATSEAQHPFAVVVTCSDSRAVPELYFDQKIGDIFVIRNAGNVMDKSALGSIEYAVKELKVPLVVVVGHIKCGAVAAALSGDRYPPNLEYNIDEIRRHITTNDPILSVRENAEGSALDIQENETVSELKPAVVSAVYDIDSGIVTFN
ncbi:hypothetical protein FACS1894120_3640 [Clostridia bacterium]|nr:hypothetical protein FACS1894120_3640 [Clostridia bacterium]